MHRNAYHPSLSVVVNRLRGIFGNLDFILLATLIAIFGLGLVVFYSAADQNLHLLKRQLIHIAVAFTMLFLVSLCPVTTLKRWSPWFYFSGILLLIMVLILGESSKGAQRWLDLGFVRFQPSEIVKLATPMMVAYYLDKKMLPIRMKDLAVSFVIVLVPTSLVILQPDLGTSLLICGAGMLAIFFAGLNYKFIASMTVAAIAAMPVFWMFMHDYQKKRVLTFLDPESDPLGSGYHIIQSKIALGSGGLFGKGWLQGTQTQLDFLPEQKTDFIFSVLGEEFGFVGILVLLALYFILILRGLYIGVYAHDTYSRLLAGSLASIFLVYIIVNIGMTCGLLPVVGVPLPLVSYGGTSMVTLMIAFGILMSIHSHKTLLTK